jgi:glycine hydroxymethyltransferase
MTAMDTPVPLPAPPPQLGAEMRSLRDWLQHADERGSRALNLVPSENRMSPLARLPLGTDFYHRYFFNGQLDPGFWEFRGGEEIAGIEVDTARYSLSRLSGARRTRRGRH